MDSTLRNHLEYSIELYVVYVGEFVSVEPKSLII